MFGKTFSSVGFLLGRSLLRQSMFNYSSAMCNLETKANYLKSVPLANSIQIRNLRELLQSKTEVGDLQLTELTSLNQIISLILRGTLTAKCQSIPPPYP